MESDLSIIVLSESLDCLPPSQTRSLQDLVKQDVNAYLDKSIANGQQFTVHEIEKLVLQSFDKHLKSQLVAPFEVDTLDEDAHEISYLDLFDYRVNTFLDACEMFGINIQAPDEAPMIAELKSVQEVKEVKKKCEFPIRGTRVQKHRQKRVPVQFGEPKNCALRAVNRKIRNIQQFIKEGTIYETHKPRFQPRMKLFKKLIQPKNMDLPLMPLVVREEKKAPSKPKPFSQFIYYGN